MLLHFQGRQPRVDPTAFVMVGIGAIVLNGARIGEEAIVGSGSIITNGTVIPPRTHALGTPAKPIREVTEEDLAMLKRIREV